MSVFKDKIAPIRSNISLPETEDSWEKICSGIVSFSELVRASSTNFPNEIVAVARELNRPINNALKSERTRLSGPTIDLVTLMASELGTGFEPLLHLYFPTLLLLCARTSKVVFGRARTCVLSIIETTQLVATLPYFITSIRDKSASLRLVAAEGTLACMNSLNPPDLEKEERTRDIETFIKMSVRDANSDVRKIGKQIFQAYELLLPTKAERFAAPLTPTSKKYLGLSSRPRSTLEIAGHSRPQTHLSSSSSTSNVPDLKPQAPKLTKKPSQPVLSSNAPSSRAPRAPAPAAVVPSRSRSRPPSRPDSAADLHIIHPPKDQSSRQTAGPMRPNLSVSRSECFTATSQHTRSVSTNSVTSGPIRYPNHLNHSASSKLMSTTGAPQRAIISLVSDAVSTSKTVGALLRIDPSGGRDCNPVASKKPLLSKLNAEEPAVSPFPDVESGKNEPFLKKPELPKSSRSAKEIMEKSKVQPTLSKKPSLRTLSKRDEHVSTVTGSDVTTKESSDSMPLHSKQLQSTASSRARTISTSISALAVPSVSRTRTTSTTTIPGLKAPATRTRAVSGGASIAASVRPRTITASKSTSNNVVRPLILTRAAVKPAWGSSSATRPGVQGDSKRVVGKDKATSGVSNVKAVGKQKRPSIVPEELDDTAASNGPKMVNVSNDEGVELMNGGENGGETHGNHEEVEPLSDGIPGTEFLDEYGASPSNMRPIELEGRGEEDGVHDTSSTDFSVVPKGKPSVDDTIPVLPQLDDGNEASMASIALDHTSNPIQVEASPHTHTQSPSEANGPLEVVISPSTPMSDAQTPVRRVGVQGVGFDLNIPADGQATPISALLSSIQRGFLFTPASPLSPPDSYLPKETGTTPVIPFPLFSNVISRPKPTLESNADNGSYSEWKENFKTDER